MLLELYLLCVMSVAFSHLFYILTLVFFHYGYLNFQIFNSLIKSRICKNIAKIMVGRAFTADQSSDILQRLRGGTSKNKMDEF